MKRDLDFRNRPEAASSAAEQGDGFWKVGGDFFFFAEVAFLGAWNQWCHVLSGHMWVSFAELSWTSSNIL